MMRRLMWAALLIPLMGAGSVRTRDGKTIEGEIEPAEGAVVVRPADGGAAVSVTMADMARAVFRAPVVDRLVGNAAGDLPQGWKSQDIGPVHRRGSAVCDANGVLTIRASGWGAWGPEDSFHYVYRPLEGDGQIVAHVEGKDASGPRMAVSVMIRQSVAPDAPMAGATIHPGGEIRMSRRILRDAPEFLRPSELPPQPWSWIRLTRRGDMFTVYRSRNGRFWEQVETRRVEMGASALIGVGAWTLANTTLGTARVDSVAVGQGTPAANWFPDGDGLLQGVVMRDGSAKAGAIRGASEQGISLHHRGEDVLIPWQQAARLVFNPVAPDLAMDRKGAWLNSGDFVEGQVVSLNMRPVRPESRETRMYLEIRSVAFGIKNLEANRDVAVAVLATVEPVRAAFRVHTADGSVYRTDSVELRAGAVLVDGKPLAGVVEIARD